jgi:hypothetical protein
VHASQSAGGGDSLRIGAGVASGAIIVATYRAYRERILQPVADAMSEGLAIHSEGLAIHVARSGKRRATRWWREHAQPAPGAMPNVAKIQRSDYLL